MISRTWIDIKKNRIRIKKLTRNNAVARNNVLGEVLGLASCHCWTCLQVHIHGQWMLPSLMHSFVGQSSIRELCPPALGLERERTEGRKREKFYIYLHVTHTHTPGRSRVNPERQEEEKSEHRRRAEGQNSAGGEGNKRTSKTNLHGETDLTKTAHTPKPHDTLRRGTRGKN